MRYYEATHITEDQEALHYSVKRTQKPRPNQLPAMNAANDEC